MRIGFLSIAWWLLEYRAIEWYKLRMLIKYNKTKIETIAKQNNFMCPQTYWLSSGHLEDGNGFHRGYRRSMLETMLHIGLSMSTILTIRTLQFEWKVTRWVECVGSANKKHCQTPCTNTTITTPQTWVVRQKPHSSWMDKDIWTNVRRKETPRSNALMAHWFESCGECVWVRCVESFGVCFVPSAYVLLSLEILRVALFVWLKYKQAESCSIVFVRVRNEEECVPQNHALFVAVKSPLHLK